MNTKLPGRSPYTVIPNFIPDALVIDKASPRPDGPIVFVGDLSRDKGVEVLMKAHRQLDTLPQLVLAGRAFDDTPVEASSRVELCGLLGHDAVIELLHSACVVVVPSLVPDCCPTVVLEAMALGRPVLAASSGGILDLVDDGVTGLLVTPGSSRALSTALAAVVDDRPAAAAMGRRALERARSFTASVVVGRIETLYEQLLIGGPAD